MDDVQTLLADLKTKGWTNASIADEIAVTVNAVEKWQAGDRNISQSRLILLTQLFKKKPPKKRRYPKDSRKSISNEEH
jgi:transcriptional regulator with XRE-family HTH domain